MISNKNKKEIKWAKHLSTHFYQNPTTNTQKNINMLYEGRYVTYLYPSRCNTRDLLKMKKKK